MALSVTPSRVSRAAEFASPSLLTTRAGSHCHNPLPHGDRDDVLSSDTRELPPTDPLRVEICRSLGSRRILFEVKATPLRRGPSGSSLLIVHGSAERPQVRLEVRSPAHRIKATRSAAAGGRIAPKLNLPKPVDVGLNFSCRACGATTLTAPSEKPLAPSASISIAPSL